MKVFADEKSSQYLKVTLNHNFEDVKPQSRFYLLLRCYIKLFLICLFAYSSIYLFTYLFMYLFIFLFIDFNIISC